MQKLRSILGFSVWEVALICGFIALFAMAAVPRFSDSQARSDVAKANRELRKLATAMEAYRIDSGSYPCGFWDGTKFLYVSCNEALLTTPIAYLDNSTKDVFKIIASPVSSGRYQIYGVAYMPRFLPPGYIRSYNDYPRTAWMTWSVGPDLVTNTGGYFPLPSVITNEAMPSPAIGRDRSGSYIGGIGYSGMRYDPTNGVVSYGDIYHFGGESKWRLN